MPEPVALSPESEAAKLPPRDPATMAPSMGSPFSQTPPATAASEASPPAGAVSPFAAQTLGGFPPPGRETAPNAVTPEQAKVRTSLASLLQGYSAAEMGFDPMMVPSWITVELEVGSLRQKTTPNGILVPLGEVVDGLTDASFRNVLSNCRRDFQIRVDPALVGMQESGNPSEAAPSATQPAAHAQAPDESLAPKPPEPPANPFAVPPSANAPTELAPLPTVPTPPAGEPPKMHVEPPAGFFAATPAATSAPAPAPTAGPEPKSFDPFAAPPAPKPEAQTPSFSPQGPSGAASAAQQDSGFSSADLLGQGKPTPAPPAFPTQPAPQPEPPQSIWPSEPKRPQPPPKKPAADLTPHDTKSDQLLLRALLGSNEPDLSPDKVVQLTSNLDGVAACVCVRDREVVAAHSSDSGGKGAEFKRQASSLAEHVRSLVPVIGIEDAETFTLAAGGRTLTFCFPGQIMVGVLHDSDPSLALRDKITLVARELDRSLG